MKGGKVSNMPAMINVSASRLMRRESRFRALQALPSKNHAASQTMIATAVTPESGPVGFHTFRTCATAVEASPANAQTPSVKAPSAAPRVAAAAAPFGGAGSPASFAMTFRVHKHDANTAADRCVL